CRAREHDPPEGMTVRWSPSVIERGAGRRAISSDVAREVAGAARRALTEWSRREEVWSLLVLAALRLAGEGLLPGQRLVDRLLEVRQGLGTDEGEAIDEESGGAGRAHARRLVGVPGDAIGVGVLIERAAEGDRVEPELGGIALEIRALERSLIA